MSNDRTRRVIGEHRIHMAPELPAAILQKHADGTLTNEEKGIEVQLGRFSRAVLEALKTPDLFVVTSVNVLLKLLDKHSLPTAIVANLAQTVLRPIAAFRSDTEQDSIVVLSVEMVDSQPLIATFKLNKPTVFRRANIHWMTSAYPKNNERKLAEWEANGLLIWKAPAPGPFTQDAGASVNEKGPPLSDPTNENA